MPDGSDDDYLAYVHGRLAELRRTAYLLCGDTHQADDFVQETLTKLYARWPRIGRVDNMDAYVRTMLVRVFLDDRRRGWWRVRLLTGNPEPPPVEGNPEDGPVVRAALAKLPPRQQAVLVLRYLCDKPVRDVAELLRCSEGTVKSQTAHGLTRLRALLGVPAFPGAAVSTQPRREVGTR